MIEAVIFDMDGLLIDTEPYWQETERKMLKKYDIDVNHENLKGTLGLRLDEQIKYYYQIKPWPEPDFEKVAREFEGIMQDFYLTKAVLMEGADYIISFFKDRGFPLALASSSSDLLINTFVQRFGFKGTFNVMHSAVKEEFGKPNPSVYISTARKLGKTPSSCLAFEDSLNGLLAAKSARMKAVIVPDHRTSGMNKYDIADMVLNSLLNFGEKEYKLLMNS